MNEEDEAALLAELLAISNKSAGSRFLGDGNDGDGLDGTHPANEQRVENHVSSPKSLAQRDMPASSARPASNGTGTRGGGHNDVLPPWKRKPGQSGSTSLSSTELDVVIAAPPPKAASSTGKENDHNRSKPKYAPDAVATGGDAAMSVGGGDHFQQQSTVSSYQGDRGGDAHDEELLALLRGVSARSGAADRFAGIDDEPDNDGRAGAHGSTCRPAPAPAPKPPVAEHTTNGGTGASPDLKEVPPWKRRQQTEEAAARQLSPCQPEMNVVVSSPPPGVATVGPRSPPSLEDSPPQKEAAIGRGGMFDNTSNFKGDRGGDAHDEELLALLRGVSAKSGAADRFDGGPHPIGVSAVPIVDEPPKAAPSAKQTPGHSNDVPLGKAKSVQSTPSTGVDAGVAEDPVSTRTLDHPASQAALMGGGGNFKQESTFHGDRGGDAHDEELLALLRGVSSKSGGANRFGESNEGSAPAQVRTGGTVAQEAPKSTPSPMSGRDEDELPSGKSGKPQADPSESQLDPHSRPGPSGGAKEIAGLGDAEVVAGGGDFHQVSTFQGERGGDANDEELLALLRGVSAKSGGANRFCDDAKCSDPAFADSLPVASDSPINEALKSKGRASWKFTPPWKKKENVRGTMEPSHEANAAVTRPATDAVATKLEPHHQPAETVLFEGGRGSFKNESTFLGERGGDAHDAELLALLRGVTSRSGRFEDNPESEHASEPVPPSMEELSSQGVPSSPNIPMRNSAPTTGPPNPFLDTTDDQEGIAVSKEDLPSAFSDGNWKVRKEAYRVLSQAITDGIGKTAPGSLDADSICPGLDSMIAKLLSEKNATALEFAMQAATEYADACKGGSSSQRAQAIVAALIKGNGFTSPRPSSAQAASSLVLKVMEVGSDLSSVTTVVSLLVDQGLGSKKTKVVQMSASLILEATYSFGAGCLPLAAIVEALPKLLTHSNKSIRDCGMEIVAEFCRALGSRHPMEDVIAKMQKSQDKELDVLLAKQTGPTMIKIGLRCQRASGGPPVASMVDSLATLQAGGAELEKERYRNRETVNLMDAIKQTEYASKLKLAKWSEKVGALDIVLKCGGEKPYKLSQPSSSSNYNPLVSEMKNLLTHTHFAVVSKAMEVLAMLAAGTGEKLYPYLRPLFPKLLQLAKDKKLTNAVSACLDTFFGNILTYEHLLDPDAALPDATNEGKEKNALARTMALDFLNRCIVRGSSAGPRATLTRSNSLSCAAFAAQKLDDSDANVRKSALNVLTSMLKLDDSVIQQSVATVVENLKLSNPRAYKALAACTPCSASDSRKASTPSKNSSVVQSPLPPKQSSPIESATLTHLQPVPAPHHPSTEARQVRSPKGGGISRSASDVNDAAVPQLQDAIARCESLDVPLWAEGEEEDGVLVGLQSAKWQFRMGAIKALAKFVSGRAMSDSCSEIERDSVSLLVLVKEHTRGFNETNMNVTRSIMELFLAICDYHENAECPLPKWAIVDGASLAVEKISDRKLSAMSKSLLLSLCVVYPLHDVLFAAYESARKLKAPSAHEEFLVWMKTFCREFGTASIGSGMSHTLSFLEEEYGSKNVKVKRAALAVLGVMHTNMGPTFKAIVLSSSKESLFREDVEKIFDDHPFDSSIQDTEWPKRCICAPSRNGDTDDNPGTGFDMSIPKMDLLAELPTDCLSRMGSKDGKTSWKARKSALDDIDKVLKSNPGLLDASNTRPLVDVLRAMRERLSDSQSNLKPLAARLIGSILGAVEGEAQGKLGKVVYAPLINAAMNDTRKIMHDSSMEALLVGTSIPPCQGEGRNEQSLEAFVVSLTGELEESEFKASGIAEVLKLAQSFSDLLPDLDKVASQRGESLGGRFSKVLVDALSSSKAEIRSATEALLSECLQANVFSIATVKRSAGRLVPAKQRSVGMILAKISSESLPPAVLDEGMPFIEQPEVKSSRTMKFEINLSSTQGSAIQKSKLPVSDIRKVDINDQTRNTKPHQHNFDDRNSAVINPLVHDSGPHGAQKSKTAIRSLTWPEFPEEPSGSSLYIGLKKAWAPIIPADSLKKLFPEGGIRKQDDAKFGFDLLIRSISMEQAGEGMAVTEQLPFILRWSIFVLCSKESTVGLTGLLDMLSSLVYYLLEIKYEFSDLEAMLFVPFLFEKASIAKGRFKDTYVDLIRSVKSSNLLPAKRLGPCVCVAILEGSSQPKARLMACQECCACVEAIGLSGIGKKGVLAAAKALSDEKLPENRAAFLELLVLLVSRMQNDIQRLSKICGSSLSQKARALIEERLAKEDGVSPLKATASTRLPRSNHSTPVVKLHVPRQERDHESRSEIFGEELPSSFNDELPALDLRESPSETRASPSRPQKHSIPSSLPRLNHSKQYQSHPDRNMVSSHPSPLVRSSQVLGLPVAVSQSDLAVSNLFSVSSEETSDHSVFSFGSSAITGSSAHESLGAAASLRARLMKIREKNKGPSAATWSTDAMTRIASSVEAPPNDPPSHAEVTRSQYAESLLEECVQAIRRLLEKSHPTLETDDDILACTDVLKNIHAAVTRQANLVGIDEATLARLRDEIKDRISELVRILTSLIGYGFNCHIPNHNSGMSVPLLSVNLASLMAIFRSSDLAPLVAVDDLTILFKETGKALLDPRLAPPSKSVEVAQVDEATSAQLVRAINKLAVQAATGAKRENSIQALISLMDQLSLKNSVCEDPLFNSRLSRVVTKLFTRVIKAEESASESFAPSQVDMEAVVCCLEDILVASDSADGAGNAEGAAVTRNLANLVVTAILTSRGEASSLQSTMSDLEIDHCSSALGKLVSLISTDLGMAASNPIQRTEAGTSPTQNDVALLVSALGSAAQGDERDQAVSALKHHTNTYGDEELNNHLEEVSAAFRAFILEQLSEEPRQSLPRDSNSMSERIKSLRSILNAPDAGVQLSTSQNQVAHKQKQGSISQATREDVAAPKPSVKAFRDRLAAAQEKRDSSASATADATSPVPQTTAGGRAATLRARLQAVKMKQSN